MKNERIEGELINDFAQVYRLKGGHRGVAVRLKELKPGQKLLIEFNTGQRKTFVGGKVNMVRIDMLNIAMKAFPTMFELQKEA